MSLQLIYTSASGLLDTTQSGYGIVARSEIMPREMRRKLCMLSRYRENSGITGVQYTYSTLGYAGQEYHVFTATRMAGADYSGRQCFIAHHLVLLPEEVAVLRRNDTRPTPAGVLLALCNAGFWCRQWSGEPRFLRSEPHLSREHLPDASMQPTWKRLTGHKRNARAFYTPPFERDCLIVASPGTDSEDILRLLHESDWLSPHCGWGKTFTTHADAGDTFREHLRWACTDDSALIHKAMRTGHPLLLISPELNLAAESEESTAQEDDVSAREFRAHLAARQAARNIPAYRYSEESDAEIYAPSVRSIPRYRKISLMVSVILLSAAGGIGTWYALQPEKRPVVKVLNPGSAHRMLAKWIAQDYNASEAESVLDEVSRLASAPPYAESSLNKGITEIVDLLRQASEASKHVQHMRRLCRLAPECTLDANRLCLVYMQEATHGRPVEDWLKSFSREELQDWETFINEAPELKQTLSHPDLLAYFDRVTNAAKPKTTVEEPVEDRGVAASQESGSVLPLTIGDELSPELKEILLKSPVSLTKGDVLLLRVPCSDNEACRQRISLHPEHCILRIETSDVPDIYQLRFINPAQLQQTPGPELLMEIRNNRLQSISSGGSPMAVSLPLIGGTEAILVPRISIPLTGILPPELPPLESVNLNIEPEDIEILPPSAEHMATSLRFCRSGDFPRLTEEKKYHEQKFSFSLPRFSTANTVAEPEISEGNPVTVRWNGICKSEQSKNHTRFTCSVTPSSGLSKKLHDTFHLVANQCCAGEVSDGDPMYSLAMVYTTIKIMSSSSTTDKEHAAAGTRYCTLFAHKKFNELMHQVLPEHPELLLSHETATSRSASAKNKRRQLIRKLDNEANRNIICQAVRRYLSSALTEVYRTEQSRMMQDTGIRLVLQSLRMNEKGELEWMFLLQPLTAKDISS